MATKKQTKSKTKAKPKAPKKVPAKKPESSAPRQVKAKGYKSFRLSKRIQHPAAKLPSAFKIFRHSIRHILDHKKVFLGIVFIYLVLTVVFVKGLGISNDLPGLKADLKEIFTGGGGELLSGFTLFSFLVGSAGSATSDVAGVYQSVLLILISLAVIWALRQTYAKEKIGVKEALYRGMYPLVPFLLVLAVIGMQLVPLVVGSTLYSIVTTGGLAVTGLEQAIWFVVFGLFALLSLYMISSSIFALYIVTLPDLTPMRALRTARELVRYRRWAVMRKVFFLPLAVGVTGALIIIPLIIFVTPIAEWSFFILTMFGLAVAHSYMYSLYRELL